MSTASDVIIHHWYHEYN